MSQMQRLRVTWSGPGVTGPGLSTFYTSTAGPLGIANAVKTFLQSQQLAFPTNVTITVPSGGDLIEDTTGALAGTWNEPGTGGSFTGTGTGDYPQGVGMQIRWRTGGIVAGRRVVGSTFFVPIMSAIFDADGTLDNATVTSLTNAGTALIAAHPDLRIFSRPKGPRIGSSHAVLTAVVPDRVSWLRSRRT